MVGMASMELTFEPQGRSRLGEGDSPEMLVWGPGRYLLSNLSTLLSYLAWLHG
jgi:hypothetical protein